MTLARAAERVGVMPATLPRWIRQGLIPQYEDSWTPAAIGQARVVAKMRERGHSLTEIRRATEDGKLAFGFLEELFPSDQRYLQFFVEQDVVGHMDAVAAAPHLEFERIGDVRLKGFTESTKVFVARQRPQT